MRSSNPDPSLQGPQNFQVPLSPHKPVTLEIRDPAFGLLYLLIDLFGGFTIVGLVPDRISYLFRLSTVVYSIPAIDLAGQSFGI
jgi:hypothetical protein